VTVLTALQDTSKLDELVALEPTDFSDWMATAIDDPQIDDAQLRRLIKTLCGSEELAAVTELVLGYDLSQLETYMRRQQQDPERYASDWWTIDQIDSMMTAYRRWMVLAWIGRKIGFRVVFTETPDTVWHMHTNLPVNYVNFTTAIFGQVFDHQPQALFTGVDLARIDNDAPPTIRMHRVLFGDEPADYVPRCGGCDDVGVVNTADDRRRTLGIMQNILVAA
jgi:hypothetical protein